MSFFYKDGNITPDWLAFTSLFPKMGAFRADNGAQEAFLDDNACALLGIKDKIIDKDTLFSVIDAITENPVKGRRNVFSVKTDGAEKWLNIRFSYGEEYTLGFVCDVTPEASASLEKKESDYHYLTGLFTRKRFINEVRTALNELMGSTAQSCMAVVHINGLERIDSELNYEKTEECVASVAAVLKRFESSDVIIGTKSYKDYFVFFRQLARSDVRDILKRFSEALKNCRITDFAGNDIQSRTGVLSATVGYCWYPSQATSLGMMISYADFALYRAIASGNIMKEFSINEFMEEKKSFTGSNVLDELIGKNDFTYHFQPIVASDDGTIFAYEALMRPKNSTPLEVLKLARDNGRLYDIELLTFENVLSVVKDNYEKFEGKKIFINSIPDNMINESDFARLCETYGDIIKNVVIEFTEQADLTDERIEKLKELFRSKGCKIAVDDYGTGYSNTAAVLKLSPDFIKIDRTLISDINENSRKQLFFSGIIDFAKANGIKVLAEGVETFEELSVAARWGAELIQGFYTARPSEDPLEKIDDDILESIRSLSCAESDVMLMKIFEAVEKRYEPYDAKTISDEGYTEMRVDCDFVYLRGDCDNMYNFSVRVADGTSTHIILENVNLNGGKLPCIRLGDNSSLRLECRGANILNSDGIYVPETATLTVVGDGALYVDAYRNNGCCIGSSCNQLFGKIIIDSAGKVELIGNGDHVVGIGGGYTQRKSPINILRGDVNVAVTGKDCVGIGAYDDGCRIAIGGADGCQLDVNASGDRSVCIGSLNGTPDIIISACCIKLNGKGVHSAGIGTLALPAHLNAAGKLVIADSRVDVTFTVQEGVGIGSKSVECDIDIVHSEIKVYFEGERCAGIGSASAPGRLSIDGSNVRISSLAGRESVDFGFKDCKSFITQTVINGVDFENEEYITL